MLARGTALVRVTLARAEKDLGRDDQLTAVDVEFLERAVRVNLGIVERVATVVERRLDDVDDGVTLDRSTLEMRKNRVARG